MYVNALTIGKNNNYNALLNANGDSVIDYINTKRVFEVGIIPLDNAAMQNLAAAIDNFNVSISYRDPITGELVEGVNCYIDNNSISYYTIRVDNVLYNAFTLTFTEL